jgi:hypothetical protein
MVEEQIAAFWEWWAENRVELKSAIASGEETDLPTQISELIQEIAPDLEWQLTKGSQAAHSFALSAAGNPQLRVVTEIWLKAAPDADEVWEFHPARQPVELAPFEEESIKIDPAAAVFETEEDELYEQLVVGVYAPGFESLALEAQMRAALTLLDGTLGEDDVERWAGFIEPLEDTPMDPRPLGELRTVVKAFAATATGDKWEVIEESDKYGLSAITTVNRALKFIDNVDRNLHLELIIEMEHPDGLGMPEPEETEVLNALEDDAFEIFGEAAVFAARETENGIRRLHFFCWNIPGLDELAADWSESITVRKVESELSVDPDWSIASRWA